MEKTKYKVKQSNLVKLQKYLLKVQTNDKSNTSNDTFRV